MTTNPNEIEAAVTAILQDVAELPDRTSPDDQPDMMLVTAEELRLIVERNLEPSAASARGVADGWRPEVVAFANLMERQLRANDHKSGWKNDEPDDLMARVNEEVDELWQAIYGWLEHTGPTEPMHRGRVQREAADVANMVMMVADVCGALPAAPSSPAATPEVEAIARKLCEQHGGDPDAVASDPHDCWDGPLWTVFLSDADAILALFRTPPATPEVERMKAEIDDLTKLVEQYRSKPEYDMYLSAIAAAARIADEHAARGEPIGQPRSYHMASSNIASDILSLAALRTPPAPAAEGWQPIETAPKDGTLVQLYCKRSELPISLGYWEDTAGIEWAHDRWVMFELDGMVSSFDPTHWMPLPAAPSSPAAAPYACAASRQSLPEPADCDWPFCGCDPSAQKVLDAIQESGFELVRPAATPEVERADLTSALRKQVSFMRDDCECGECQQCRWAALMERARETLLSTPPAPAGEGCPACENTAYDADGDLCPLCQPDIAARAIAAGDMVLKGEGTGTYDEAEDAIRLLIEALRTTTTSERTTGFIAGRDAAAGHLDAKANEMRGCITGDMMARIFEEQAAAIRAIEPGEGSR